MTEYHGHRDGCPFKFATLDACDCVEKNMLDRIEALTANLTKALEALLTIVDNGGAGSYHLARTTLAEIKSSKAAPPYGLKGESHE